MTDQKNVVLGAHVPFAHGGAEHLNDSPVAVLCLSIISLVSLLLLGVALVLFRRGSSEMVDVL